jgi:uncharacterized membrane protein
MPAPSDHVDASTPTEDELAADRRSLGRVFGLADAVFAISMTLLALDLKVPALGPSPTTAALGHALLKQLTAYESFLISFYVTAGYWRSHHREMRAVTAVSPLLLRLTFFLLLMVTTMPFAASLLGSYGNQNGLPLAVYGTINVLANIALLLIRAEARRRHLYAVKDDSRVTNTAWWLWTDLAALALSIPAGFVFPGHGPDVLIILLVLSGLRLRRVVGFLWRRIH